MSDNAPSDGTEMKLIEVLKKTNTILAFILLVTALFLAGYLMMRLRKPLTVVHVAVDSLRVGKKKQ